MIVFSNDKNIICLLYTSDAADERSSVDLGGRRIIKKKTKSDTIDRRSFIKNIYRISRKYEVHDWKSKYKWTWI